MRRIDHLKELIIEIKKTEEMISLHKETGLEITIKQYEDLKARQIAELIDELAMPPFQTIESFSIIKLIINKYYPKIDSANFEQRDLKELMLSI